MIKTKKKFTKIILLITIILVSLLGYGIYTLAADSTDSYMAIYGKWVGWLSNTSTGDKYLQNFSSSYLQGSEDTKKGFLGKAFKYPRVRNTSSDYWYVPNYRQVWCLSHNQENKVSDERLLTIYGIIEIGTASNPTYSKLYYLDNNDEKKIERGITGEGERRRAESAFTMFVGANSATDNLTGVAQRNFYDTFSSVYEDKNIKYLKRFYDDETRDTTDYTANSFDSTKIVSGQYNTYAKDPTGKNFTAAQYADAVVKLNDPIDTGNYSEIKCEPTSFTDEYTGKKMNTKIVGTREDENSNVFNMSANSGLVKERRIKLYTKSGKEITYKIEKRTGDDRWTLYDGNTIKGRLTLSSGSIYLIDSYRDNEVITIVKMETDYYYIHGIVYMLANKEIQTRGISKGEWKIGTKSVTVNVASTAKPDVSMQKYITKVNGVEDTTNNLGRQNGAFLRANTKTETGEDNSRIINGTNFRKAAPASDYNVKSWYKRDKLVTIKTGDKVTYRISVYNNKNEDAHNVRIEDRLPYYYKNLKKEENGKDVYEITTAVEVYSVKLNGSQDITSRITEKKEEKSETNDRKYEGNFKRIVYTIDTLTAKDENTYLEVTLVFTAKLNNHVFTNTAFIYCDGNQKTYRTADRDYVKMVGNYQVSLEKFVSKVNGQSVTGRTGENKATAESEAVSKYRFNESMKATGEENIDTLDANNKLNTNKKELDNLHFNKYNKPVDVDSGDKVTFTIRLRNTGDSPVKITQIYDSFRFVEEGKYNGVKLVYDEAAGITGNGGGTIETKHYNDDKSNANKILDRYLINFDNAVLLNNKNDYVDVHITYTVKIPTEVAGENLILQNKAGIRLLENANGVSVKDEDGNENNFDMDFLTNKRYSVSLEKYVSKVTSKDNKNTYNSNDREGYRHNESLAEGHKERNPYKEQLENRVPVEIGDTVQYTIKLTNTGENPVKITQIYDTFGYVADNSFSVLNSDGAKNVGLKFIKAEAPEGYTIKLENEEYNKNAIQNRFNRYLFSISGNSIKPNESIYLYLAYEVDIPFDISDKEYSLFNKAGIITDGIKNNNGITVTDSDKTDNNYDMDWIKTKIYKVSLEKYVSKVTDKNGNNELSYDRSGKRYNAYAQDKTNIDNYNRYKKDNPVMVEKGDKVTYTIILKNEGEASIKIRELYDYYSLEGLKYSGIKGNVIVGEIMDEDYYGESGKGVYKRRLSFRDPITLEAGETTKLGITFDVELKNNTTRDNFCNVARVKDILNKNDIPVKDSDGPDNNTDEDWIKLKEYKVSLEKYIEKVNDSLLPSNEAQREGKAEYLTYENGQYKDRTDNDTQYTVHNTTKYNNAVTVVKENESDKVSVEYKIKITNNGETNVYITEITDYLPDGIIYKGTRYDGGQYCTNIVKTETDILQTDNEVKFTDLADTVIEPGTSKILTVKVDEIIEPANSNKVLKNVAQITGIKNRNGVGVEDTTPNNNRDADYIVLNYGHRPEYVDYTVEKIWVDGNNVANKRPDEITLDLYRDGEKQEGKELKLNASNNWKDAWKELKKDDGNGHTYTYTAIERAVAGYSSKHEHTGSGTIITNTRETTTKTVRKVWMDEEGRQITDTSKLSEITVKIYQNGTEYGTVKLNNSNNWQYTWTLPEKDDNGNDYIYTIKEDNVPEGYVASYTPDGEGIIITNKESNPPPGGDKVSKTVRKVWKDEEGKEISDTSDFGTIRVQLTQDGVPMNGKVVELNRGNNWTHTWENLTKANGNNEYQYSVKELDQLKDYTVNVTPCGDEIIVTNQKIKPPEKISKTVNKIWLDVNGKEIKGSESIKVQLYQDGNKYGGEITLRENKWTHTWDNLDKYDSNGNEYTYTVKEVIVPEGYDDIYVGDGFTIQNKQIEYTEITVKKAWVDNNDEAGARQSSVNVQLYKDGNKFGDEIPLNEGNNWTYTWTGLTKEAKYEVREENVPKGYEASYIENGSTIIIKNIYTDNPGPNPPDDPDIPTPDLPGGSVISGYVWNDEALNKVQTNYDGKYDLEEDPVYGVEVKLYRVEDKKVIATATTNLSGYYGFGDADLALNAGLAEEERFIKGKKQTYINPETGEKEVSNIWESYYSYYIVFEYDGITYTSTVYNDVNSKRIDSLLDSNAKEDNGIVKESRTEFNNRFSTINNNSGINYYTINRKGYIPQSIHYYDKNSMSIQSATSLIKMEPDTDISKDLKLKYVNLGLRGKDVFDLELTSDVAQIDVIINNQKGVYKYANKVSLRREDIVIDDDMANVRKEVYDETPKYVYQNDEGVNQQIRRKDWEDKDGLQEIKVTYKITVHNTSPTAGTATLITNYYDDEYTFDRAYAGNTTLSSKDGESGTGYKSRVIETPKTKLEQGNTMDIYVVYTLNNPSETLKDKDRFATYNLAEITEYKTERGAKQSEHIRGLLDKDSAPCSANKEQVRLETTEGQNTLTTGGNPTTVEYYFSGKDLSIFKYEDDTFATPTLYFVKNESKRIITGTIFEDKTKLDENKIKSGNGVFNREEKDVSVYGATVLLLEKCKEGTTVNTSEKVNYDGVEYDKYYEVDGIYYELRDKTESKENGEFTFEGFLPGHYIIVYHYGDTEKTTLVDQSEKDGIKVNAKSYNGEDFQSTNNTGTYGYKLNETVDYWYVYNESEGVSTGVDNIERRVDVSKEVTGFRDEELVALNNIRVSDNAADVEVRYSDEEAGISDTVVRLKDIIDWTRMYANTKSMLFTVERTELRNEKLVQKNEFADYIVENMNFGIAEVPVTTVDLQKYVSAFTITDSTGRNILASNRLEEQEDGTLKWGRPKGDVLIAEQGENIDISIENEELQGARLEIEYTVSVDIETEVNFDNKMRHVVPTITGIIDFVDNNLSYNEVLGDNSKYWEVVTYEYARGEFAKQKYDEITNPEGTVDKTGTKYTTILKATEANPLVNNKWDEESATVTLEKVLTSTDSTIEGIITSTLDMSAYSNIVEIVGFDYKNTSTGASLNFAEGQEGIVIDSNGNKAYVMRDRIRTNIIDENGRKVEVVIIPGSKYDSATSEILVIHPPTGDSSISMIYLLVAIMSLGILAAGIFGIKKFVIKK